MNKSILIILAITFFFAGCGNNCPKFNEEILQWMPYHENEKLSFINNKGEEIELEVTSCNITHTDNIGFGKCGCESNYTVTLNSESLLLKCLIDDYEYFKEKRMHINNQYLNLTRQLDSYNFNGKAYKNVCIYERTLEEENSFLQIIQIKDIGIVEFTINDEQWVKKDLSTKKINISMVSMNISNC